MTKRSIVRENGMAEYSVMERNGMAESSIVAGNIGSKRRRTARANCMGRQKNALQTAAFFLLMTAVLLMCVGCGKQKDNVQTEAAMGRYAEREIELPGTGYSEAYLMEDGSYLLCGEGKYVQSVSADGTATEVNGLWRRNVNIHLEMVSAVSPSGGIMLGYLPLLSESDYETMSDEEQLRYSYLYVTESGERHLLTPSGEGYTGGTNLEYFAFSPDGRLYTSDKDGNVFCMDTESGSLQFLFRANDKITEFGFIGTTLIGLDTSQAWIYDLESDTLQKPNEVLDEFVVSHQAKGKSIVLCSGGAKEDILYLGCRTGLYQYVWGGSTIEQIADGQLLSFGNSFYSPAALQALDNGGFLAFFNPGHLVELYYDESLPSEPEQMLSVYSLEEDSRVRYAAQLFQKEHPEVLVRYETGMDGDNAVSKEDALKNLNTKLLAGEVPDVMVMDGIDIEQYAEKGVLKKLDTLLQPYLEENLLYGNIVEGMRMTETESVYALPMAVWVPSWMGERSYMEGETSLEEIVAAYEQARADHPENALLSLRGEEDLLLKMIFTSIPAWTKEDGSLDQDKAAEFFAAVQRIWELNEQGMTEDEWALMREYYAESDGWDTEDMLDTWLGDMDWDDQRIWLDIGRIRDVVWLLYKVDAVITVSNGDYGHNKGTDVWFGTLNGQAQNVFWAQSIVGICEKASEPELAEEFYKLLLSDEMMNKWWLGNEKAGFPISRRAAEWILDADNNEYEQYKGFKNRNKEFWITEEVQQQFLEMMEAASTFYQPGTVLEELAVETGVRVCRDELTPEEGAAEVASRMAIEMEE